MRRYHHIGIPTSQARPGERHIEDLKIFIVGHEHSEYGVEWMRFEADAPIPELVRQQGAAVAKAKFLNDGTKEIVWQFLGGT